MAKENKKFLDYAGTTHLWSKIKDELEAKVDSVTATNDSISVGGTSKAPAIAVQISSKTGNALSIQTGEGEKGLYVASPAEQVVYSITQDESSSDYAAVYHLTANGSNTGVAINIPKDMVVSRGNVETKNAAGTWGEAGTYLHLVLANATNDDIYINVSNLIEYVTSGSAAGDMVVIDVSDDHKVTATITDGTITKDKLATTVKQSLDKADTALQKTEIKEGATNGSITVRDTVVQVHGLGSAAFTNSSAYDTAGAADEVYNAIIALTNTEIDNAIAAANT